MLAALLDAAAYNVEQYGLVPPDELRRGLTVLEAEWAAEGMDTRRRGIRPTAGRAEWRCRTSPETCNLSQQAADSAPGRGGAP